MVKNKVQKRAGIKRKALKKVKISMNQSRNQSQNPS